MNIYDFITKSKAVIFPLATGIFILLGIVIPLGFWMPLLENSLNFTPVLIFTIVLAICLVVIAGTAFFSFNEKKRTTTLKELEEERDKYKKGVNEYNGLIVKTQKIVNREYFKNLKSTRARLKAKSISSPVVKTRRYL